MPISPIEHIVKREDVRGGAPCIAGHRITVHHIVLMIERHGHTPDEIADMYDLTLGQVYAALSYYHDHKAEIDAIIAAGDRTLEVIQNLPDPGDEELWRVLTVAEVAAIFHLDERTVREAVENQWIYGRKAGGTWIMRRADAEQRWGHRRPKDE